MSKALVYSKYNNAKISPKKVAPVMDLVRGKDAMEAKLVLSFDRTKAGAMLLKTLKSAIANAKNNLNISASDLFVSELRVDMGNAVKVAKFAGRGRYRPVLKRSSHLVLGLSKKAVKESK
jgi:large subunit ribosomal protein L22